MSGCPRGLGLSVKVFKAIIALPYWHLFLEDDRSTNNESQRERVEFVERDKPRVKTGRLQNQSGKPLWVNKRNIVMQNKMLTSCSQARVTWSMYCTWVRRKVLVYNRCETRDKRPLGRDSNRSWFYCHTTSMITLFFKSYWQVNTINLPLFSTVVPACVFMFFRTET